jgi:hypothetical protein
VEEFHGHHKIGVGKKRVLLDWRENEKEEEEVSGSVTKDFFFLSKTDSGVDPGFVVRGGVSRRGVRGPLKVPSGSKAELW